jgi:hypothetical protein
MNACCALCLGGCIGKPYTRVPLYEGAAQLSDAEVATLEGEIAKVDHQSVPSSAAAFLLLPGCHLVEPPDTWGESGTGGNAVLIAHIPKVVFAIDMKPAYRYVVMINGQTWNQYSRVELQAYEVDPAGRRTAEYTPFDAVRSTADCAFLAHQGTRNVSSATPE